MSGRRPTQAKQADISAAANARYREILAMREQEKKPIAAICAALGLKQNRVNRLLKIARERREDGRI